ncbi:SDR family NAD(P)-dependent oxidoreductase, partial [Lactococcus sp. EKM502L]
MKYTVVTGASSGIGRATAIKLANLGYNLIIVARRTDKLNELKSEINNKYPNIDVVVKPTDL